jgi:exosortase/archaeosortase family protein
MQSPSPETNVATDVQCGKAAAKVSGLYRGLVFALLSLLLYGFVYYPHEPTSLAARTLFAYAAWVARGSAWLIGLFGEPVGVTDDTLITGRFPLRIVLDCAALDVLALYVAAVLAYPARWFSKVSAVLLGAVFLSCANLGRILALYFAGVYAPERFDLLHEDVLAFAMVASALFAFAGFAALMEQGRRQVVTTASGPAQ